MSPISDPWIMFLLIISLLIISIICQVSNASALAINFDPYTDAYIPLVVYCPFYLALSDKCQYSSKEEINYARVIKNMSLPSLVYLLGKNVNLYVQLHEPFPAGHIAAIAFHYCMPNLQILVIACKLLYYCKMEQKIIFRILLNETKQMSIANFFWLRTNEALFKAGLPWCLYLNQMAHNSMLFSCCLIVLLYLCIHLGILPEHLTHSQAIINQSESYFELIQKKIHYLEIQLTIDQISFTDLYDDDFMFLSEKHSLPGDPRYAFQLCLWSNDQQESVKGENSVPYLALDMHFLSETIDKVTARYQISVLDTEGNKNTKWNKKRTILKDEKFTIPKLLRLSYFQSPDFIEDYLPDDRFTLLCEIWIEQDRKELKTESNVLCSATSVQVTNATGSIIQVNSISQIDGDVQLKNSLNNQNSPAPISHAVCCRQLPCSA